MRPPLGQPLLTSAPLLQLKDSLRQLQAERDQYVTNLKEENAIWQQKMQQVLEQVRCDLQSPPPPHLG